MIPMLKEMAETYVAKFSSPFAAYLHEVVMGGVGTTWGNSTDGPGAVTWVGGRHVVVEHANGAVEHVHVQAWDGWRYLDVPARSADVNGAAVWNWIQFAYPDVAAWELGETDDDDLDDDEPDVQAALDDVLARIKAYTANRLAGDADCFSPDSSTSAGAHFLTSVRDNVVGRVEGFDADDLDALRSDDATVNDVVSEIADAAPDVYTSTLWAEFVDLGAYVEDPTEMGADGSNMDQSARVCLYIIAERLAQALFTEIHEALREA
jgi:hypothetical protein